MTDDSNLRDNANPYAAGSPAVDFERPSTFPVGAVPGYYSPGPLGDQPEPGNQMSAGAGTFSAPEQAIRDGIAGGLDNVYAEVLGYQTGGDASEPSNLSRYVDSGIQDESVPRGQRS